MSIRETENSLKRKLVINSGFCVIALLPPILSIICPVMPEGETQAEWFQRSGSLMVVIAILIELRLITIQEYFDPLNVKYTVPIDLPRALHISYGVIVTINTLIIIAGTLIWGYGDIPLKNT